MVLGGALSNLGSLAPSLAPGQRGHRRGLATEGLQNLLGQSFPAERGGRPPGSSELRALIQRMAVTNPYWGAPRIHGELLKLGIAISERTVSRFMPKNRKPPSQTWRAFLNNHVQDLVSVDFFTVPTVSFRVLFVLVVLAHHRRRHRSLQRDGAPDGRVDRATDGGGVSRGSGPTLPVARQG